MENKAHIYGVVIFWTLWFDFASHYFKHMLMQYRSKHENVRLYSSGQIVMLWNLSLSFLEKYRSLLSITREIKATLMLFLNMFIKEFFEFNINWFIFYLWKRI